MTEFTDADLTEFIYSNKIAIFSKKQQNNVASLTEKIFKNTKLDYSLWHIDTAPNFEALEQKIREKFLEKTEHDKQEKEKLEFEFPLIFVDGKFYGESLESVIEKIDRKAFPWKFQLKNCFKTL